MGLYEDLVEARERARRAAQRAVAAPGSPLSKGPAVTAMTETFIDDVDQILAKYKDNKEVE